MWQVAGPSEYLAITGRSIVDVKLAKKAWIWPTQKCVKFHVLPVNYTFDFLPFFIRAVFTIRPRVTDHQSLLLYAKLIASHVNPSSHVKNLVQGIMEGQTCIFDPSMTMQHIFEDFLEKVLEKIQLELNQFGLVIYNANLVDAAKTNMKIKVSAGQTKQNFVKADLETKAKMKGKVGAGQTKQNFVKTDLETKVKMKGKVGAGQTKQNLVKTDLETKAKMKGKVGAGQTTQNFVKTDLETKTTAMEMLKVEIKVTRAVKTFKSSELAKVEVQAQKTTGDATLYAHERQQDDKGMQAPGRGMYVAVLLKQFGL